MSKVAHFIALDTIGGVEMLFESLLANSAERPLRHDLVLYTAKIHPHLRRSIREHVADTYRIKGYGPLRLPKVPRALRRWNSRRIVRRLDADAVVFWNSINYGDYLGGDDLRLLRSKTKVVFYDHGASWSRKRSADTETFLSSVDTTLCCSHASKRLLELYHGHTGEKEVLLNPLRPNVDWSVAAERTLPCGRPLRLGTAGRLVNVKGICLAIQALAALSSRGVEAELHVVGVGPLRASLERLAGSLGVARRVHFRGLLRDMPAFFRQLDLFLCPSIREPFGLVAIEALATGCPVICSRVDGLAEAVSHERTGMTVSPSLPLSDYERLGGGLGGLPPVVYYPDSDSVGAPMAVDPRDVADAVEAIIGDGERYRSMSRAGIEDCKARFDYRDYLTRFHRSLGTPDG